MVQPVRNRSLVIALYVNAALLLAVLVAMISRGGGQTVLAGVPSPQPIAGGANLYLMPAQFSANKWGCYVLDIDAQTLLAYYYTPKNDGTDLQLVAARKITYDRRLTNFNSTNPSWTEVKKWVDQANQSEDPVIPSPKPGQDKSKVGTDNLNPGRSGTDR
ncbi:MAG TPA: hypothetical protein VIM11_01140 [Tepidisphaeraceae bacterium]